MAACFAGKSKNALGFAFLVLDWLIASLQRIKAGHLLMAYSAEVQVHGEELAPWENSGLHDR